VAYLGVPRIQIEEVLSFYAVPPHAGRPLASGLSRRVLLIVRLGQDHRHLAKFGIAPG
jgi:hypothetical protein